MRDLWKRVTGGVEKARERLAGGMEKTRQRLANGLEELFQRRPYLDDAFVAELEEVLIGADVGPELSAELVAFLRERARREAVSDPEGLRRLLSEALLELLQPASSGETLVPDPASKRPHVISVVGVNGVGKTTTIGKLAHRYQLEGHRPLIVAADTFRAAATEQLEIWATRAGVEIVRGQTGADPGAVAYDGIQAARARGATVVFVDTAGRLQTNQNLMAELAKIHRVLGKACEGAPHEVLLVLDAVLGQNGLRQAQIFRESAGVTGLVLTKLDGSARGGAILPIVRRMATPVRWMGIGEGIGDLEPFRADLFVEALLRPAPPD